MKEIAGKYQVVSELGGGGYGKVYLVQHKELPVRYALKLLNRQLSDDERFIERFKREAGILQRFFHPYSVPLRDFGRTDDGLYYMAMDYAEGDRLDVLISERGAFDLATVLTLMDQILEVMEAAHRAGIIHRDIKPDNIVVQTDEQGQRTIKMLDFGIAKLKEQMVSSTRTLEGATIGTPQYMAPEQAAGEVELDHRVDIYAAGVLMYEMITGKVPFLGDTVIRTLLMHITQAPPPIDPELRVPDLVEELVLRALQKDRELRFQSAAEFRRALQRTSDHLLPKEEVPVAAVPGKTSAGTPGTVSSSSAEPEPQPQPVKVLCLDDNEMILNILKHVLEVDGYQVYTATSFTSIHSYIFEEHVDVLVTDVQMPGLSGTKICRMLKETVPELKVLLFSNVPERDLERMSRECRADDWICKSEKPQEWLRKVRTVAGSANRSVAG